MKQILRQLPRDTIRFLFIHVLQVCGLLFWGWPPYAVVVMWTFEIYVLFFSEVVLFVVQQKKKQASWFSSYGIALAYALYWVSFGIGMYVFGIYLLNPGVDLDTSGTAGVDVWMTTRTVVSQFWYMFVCIVYDAVMQLRQDVGRAPQKGYSLADGKGLVYTMGYGVCYLLAMAWVGQFGSDPTYMIQEEGARLFALLFTLFMCIVGPAYIRKRKRYEHT
jgi:signal transduction histidine kinase